jgi:hypothetical protein
MGFAVNACTMGMAVAGLVVAVALTFWLIIDGERAET